MRQTPRAARHHAGFSMVEMLIGLMIGMIAVIVMMQVFSVSEGYKRTTTGGDDAQNNGAIALYALQRDLRQSGLGVSAIQVIGCDVTLRAGVTLSAMSPVTINHASIPAADAGDTLLVVYGNAPGSNEGESVQAKPSLASYTIAAAASSASSPGAFAVGDRVIGQFQPRPTPCNLSMEPVTAVAGTTVSVAVGVANTGGILYNLGQTPKVLVYAVRRGNLTVCDYTANDCSVAGSVANSAIWVPIASNIVSLRAQYGRDTAAPMKATVDTYDQTAPATACDWARVLAVRFVLVARSSELDKTTVTNAAPTWGGAASQPIDLSGVANWQRFRYKTFQTVVPLRNMAWQGAQTGC
ncbi:MAG: PilW family protein [Burkholderiales bacterium]|jgi:type IV pilus assembly protein PilW|nr:PilW family protein [Burkholderiales bacterium]